MKTKGEAWFIESIDARAGLCFASFRGPTLLADDFVDGPAVFIAPPFFEPENLASRVPGMSAARGSFQLGLFADAETEMPFASLEDVVEFVRRCYSGGGGGDAANGLGGPVGPPSDSDDGQPPDQPSLEPKSDLTRNKEEQCIPALQKDIASFARLTETLEGISYENWVAYSVPDKLWLKSYDAHLSNQIAQDNEIFTRCGVRIAAELFRRRTSEDRWASTVRSLGSAFSHLRIWPSILLSSAFSEFTSACDDLVENYILQLSSPKQKTRLQNNAGGARDKFARSMLFVASGIDM